MQIPLWTLLHLPCPWSTSLNGSNLLSALPCFWHNIFAFASPLPLPPAPWYTKKCRNCCEGKCCFLLSFLEVPPTISLSSLSPAVQLSEVSFWLWKQHELINLSFVSSQGTPQQALTSPTCVNFVSNLFGKHSASYASFTRVVCHSEFKNFPRIPVYLGDTARFCTRIDNSCVVLWAILGLGMLAYTEVCPIVFNEAYSQERVHRIASMKKQRTTPKLASLHRASFSTGGAWCESDIRCRPPSAIWYPFSDFPSSCPLLWPPLFTRR